jgi:hypothetical protein
MTSPSRPPKDGPGWETTYREFVGLLGDLQHRAVVAPLLREWFGYVVVGAKGTPQIRSLSGERIALDDVHRRVQSYPERRYEFYQRKMSCYHWDDFAERHWQEHLAGEANAVTPTPRWRRLFTAKW